MIRIEGAKGSLLREKRSSISGLHYPGLLSHLGLSGVRTWRDSGLSKWANN